MKKISGKKSPRTFYIYTLGCKTNQSESDNISKRLSASGLRPSLPGQTPDMIIINTCTVTSAADKKSRQIIRRVKKEFPSSVLIVTGCFTVFNEEFLKRNGVDLIASNKEKGRIADILGIHKNPLEDYFLDTHSRALVKIQDGCEQNCSYCIVPLVRGSYNSEPQENIIREITRLQKEGHDEVVLTGIHIGRYGIDLVEKSNGAKTLSGLLSDIIGMTDIKRIRLSSLEINELTEEIMHLIPEANGRIARHLHIPLQSGSTEILKKMNRPYSCDYFVDKIRELKKVVPGAVLTTDIIVGFPGETEKDFLQTMEIARAIGFSKIHVFKYSPREGTGAFLMNGRVDEKEIRLRSARLRRLGDQMRNDFMNTLAGRYLDAVCEEYDRNKNIACGISEQYVRTYFDLSIDDFNKKRGKIIRILAKTLWRDGILGDVK